MRGRSRTIKPELFADEQLGDLERSSGLPIFRAFVGLLVFADREGRFRWAPRALRGAIAPCWEGDFELALEALASRSFIIRYTVNGEDFGYIRSFHKHQAIHPNEARSVLPPPDAHGATAFPVIPGNPSQASGSAVEHSGSLQGTLTQLTRSLEVEVDPDARASRDATALHRERKAPPSGSRPGRVYTMPCEAPPREYLDDAVMAGVSREQAAATWTHYWTVGLPERGVEKLYPFLVKSAKERANATTKVPGARRSRSSPDDRLQAQLDRVEMLRAEEAEEERRAAGGGT